MAEKYHFWMRAEVKPNEFRTLLLPEHVKTLIEAGHKVTVEHSPDRCVADAEYAALPGVVMAPLGSWTTAPKDVIVLGLKELEVTDTTTPLTHRHTYFAHCYKGQGGADDLLKRFVAGEGKLWDLEFLNDERGRRVAAFGKSAGAVGMALGFWTWAGQVLGQQPPIPSLTKPYKDWDALAVEVRSHLDTAIAKAGRPPKTIIFGALGRCGSGAIEFAARVGMTEHLTKWDLEETKKGGPFVEILEHEIMLNCIYLMHPIPPFFNTDLIPHPKRTTSVIIDVSCDASNPNNPIPVYNRNTTFSDPLIQLVAPAPGVVPLDLMSIDHLPSLVPLESSREFAGLMFPHILAFNNSDVWHRALTLFQQKTAPFR